MARTVRWRILQVNAQGSLIRVRNIANTGHTQETLRQMKLRDTDLDWLADSYPGLRHDPTTQQLVGDIDFCAAYDVCSGQVSIGGSDPGRRLPSFLCDKFAIKVELNCVDSGGWPRVYEVGGRFRDIAKRQGVEIIDSAFLLQWSLLLGNQVLA